MTALPSPACHNSWAFGDVRPPETRVSAAAGDRDLVVRFTCGYEDPSRLAPRTPEQPLHEGEHVWIELYPFHDAIDQFRFVADFKGLRSVKRSSRMTGERSLGGVYDRWQASIADAPLLQDWRLLHGIDAASWWAELIIPWRTLGLISRPCTFGLAYGRAVSTRPYSAWLAPMSWPKPMDPPELPPMLIDHGEALVGELAGAPEAIELRPRRFSRNHGRIVLGTDWPRPPASLRVSVRAPDGQPVRTDTIDLCADENSVDFNYILDRTLSSYLDPFRVPQLSLECLDSRGERLYGRRLPMDRHFGLTVGEPYGESAPEPMYENPDQTFRHRGIRRVARRLPSFRRATTAQQAPSDFCLVDARGGAINLMREDAWRRLGHVIESEFASRDDRLVAAMVLVAQKNVTNYILAPMFYDARGKPAYHSMLHELMGPLSIVRYGGGPAIARAGVLARLLAHIADPNSGEPFVARVVAVGLEGGPRHAGRSFLGPGRVTGFGVFPGPLGAVAVECHSGGREPSFTLLDPTGLIVFTRADGTLATLDEITNDPALRNDGAGRLADVYSRIDQDEIRRLPANRLLSRGVFPELAPDEDGADVLIDARDRQTPRHLIAPRGVWSPWLDGFARADGSPGRRDGAVRLRQEDERLTIEVEVTGIAPHSFDERDAQAETLNLAFDLEHGHHDFVHLIMTFKGETRLYWEQSSSIQRLFKHLSTESQMVVRELPGTGVCATVRRRDDGYTALVTVPWSALALDSPCDPPPVIGFNAWLEGRWPEYEQVYLCPPRFRLADAFSFADVYLGRPAIVVEEIDLGVVGWGSNVARLRLRSLSDRAASVVARTTTRLCMRRHERHAIASCHLEPGATFGVEVPFWVDPEEKFTTSGGQEIELTLEVDGELAYRGGWRGTYCEGVCAYQRYGSQLGARTNPRPCEPEFLSRKIEFLGSRLPVFERLTTRQGAPSDFFLRAEDGSAEFNLMEPGVLDRMAAYVAGRFDEDLDKVLGVYLFSQAPWIARHLSTGHRLMQGAGPLSIMRGYFAGGGGNCAYHSRVFTGLAARLVLRGHPLDAHTSAVWGHTIASVAGLDGRALIDADAGHVFLLPDGSGLATIQHVRRSLDILTTAGPGDLARYLAVSDIRDSLLPCQSPQAPGVFPLAAPAM
jgi:hypothetical protein